MNSPLNTRDLIHHVARPLGGIGLAELQGLRGQLAAGRAEQEARLAELEAKQETLFADGAGRSDLRGQRARAGQIAALEDEASHVSALLRVSHKQLLLLDRLIWLRESLDAIERLRQDTPAAAPFDWPALLDATEPLGDDEARLDQLNDALEAADSRPQMADGRQQVADGKVQSVDGAARQADASQPPGLLVVRVFDGATIELATGQRVRYIGVDAPLMHNTLGRPDAGAYAARDANQALAGHKRVRLEADALDADIDGALWRYVYVGDKLINAELLRQGAVYYAGRYPNNRLAETLLAAERDARRRRRGVWKSE